MNHHCSTYILKNYLFIWYFTHLHLFSKSPISIDSLDNQTDRHTDAKSFIPSFLEPYKQYTHCINILRTLNIGLIMPDRQRTNAAQDAFISDLFITFATTDRNFSVSEIVPDDCHPG